MKQKQHIVVVIDNYYIEREREREGRERERDGAGAFFLH